jgi:hypothetical protein
MDAGGKAVKAKVGGEEPIVVLEAERVNLRLKHRDRVSELGGLYCPKENVTAAAVIKVEVDLFLKAEIE